MTPASFLFLFLVFCFYSRKALWVIEAFGFWRDLRRKMHLCRLCAQCMGLEFEFLFVVFALLWIPFIPPFYCFCLYGVVHGMQCSGKRSASGKNSYQTQSDI